MKIKKGQAALEFLTSYGFAFLIIIVVFGAFAYFGILNPYNLLPDYCNTGIEVSCEDIAVQSGNIKIILKNNLDKAIQISSIEFPIEVRGSEEIGHCNFIGSEIIGTGEIKTITTTESCLLLNKGEKKYIQPTIHYSFVGGTFEKTNTGNAITS